ncbi:manganese ABC transporter ATP-binding protein [Paenibacillus amylolyticus]|uniref:Manganese ABC transporter ATP-binding protein n=1 Tax=Paenibacillus amylolyticus TaxID=1451 RepID=A0A117I1C4_PAEAM|nr:metal ABC transporter ATP-binding protein [Paenibacillus amylolyticus]OMF07203.1 manganese ABC transporter ATP-binding protein [Paenibacillus amylolyticus]GAS81932.1 manganese ABC transporter ATP-binding protein [Paenibacillus amylolyticus]
MIQISQLNVDYFGNPALQNVDIDIPLGFTIGIIGPNGAGKSTFIKSLLGVIKKRTGNVTVNGTAIAQEKKNIAYVPQKSDVDLTFPITVRDTILTGTYPKLKLFQRPGKKEKAYVDHCMELVDIADLANKQISNLSGGQLQRVFIARALAQQADIFFLDEPFVGIDLVSERIIVDLLKNLREQGKTILIVHHDLHEVEEYFDKIIILNKKLVAFGDVSSTFTTENIQAAYGSSLGNIQIKGLGDVQND